MQKKIFPTFLNGFTGDKMPPHGGIGIGLSLSKAIIESQNGTISAKNLSDGGACFEIRFYSH